MQRRETRRLLVLSLLLLAGCSVLSEQPADGEKQIPHDMPKSFAPLFATADAKLASAGTWKPLAKDADQDGSPDAQELAEGTNPYWPDTDGDRIPDGTELKQGTSPVKADADSLASYYAHVKVAHGTEMPVAVPLLVNPSSCTLTAFNTITCTATCVGTCLFGAVSCYWSWDPLQWALDQALGAPCPGWGCHCP